MKLFDYAFKAMGGPCELHLWCHDEQAFAHLKGVLVQEVKRLEAKYSRYQSESFLSKLNRGEFNNKPLDDETAGLLNYAQQCFDLSGHLFDPTVGILRQVWQYNETKLPSESQLALLLDQIGWQKLAWDGKSLQLPAFMEIDLGGIVKEFAADRLCVLLKQAQVAGLVNLAGDISVSGPPANAEAWTVAVQHPRARGAIAQLALTEGAVAASGDYERFIEVDGRRYCHLLRPDTGYPAESSFSSVSVIAPSCLMAGSVATIAMLKGAEGIHWLEELALPFLAFDDSLNAFGSIEV